jgi:hypothetical protein|tara:strand:- start:2181 stop:2450 length:270 start_codon:yes stop_codon:yes gene_type:complete
MCNSCKGKITTQKSIKNGVGCPVTYSDLLNLDLKILKVIKLLSINSGIHMEVNTQLVAWRNKINTICPEEDEYETIKTFVNNEYTSNFP